MKKTIAALATTLVLVGCGSGTVDIPKMEVEAVYWHERARYSVAVMRNNEIDHIHIDTRNGLVPIKLIADVEDGARMWLTCSYTYSKSFASVTGPGCEIHVHGIDSIGTGGWNHGKFGSGMTTRLH